MKKQLKNDWKEDLQEQQEDLLFKKALRQKMDQELRGKWSQQLMEQGIDSKPPFKITYLKSRRRYLSAVAAVFLLLAAVWWLFVQSDTENKLLLADQYITELGQQVVQVRMGDDKPLDPLWQSARGFYTKKNYTASINELLRLSQNTELTPEQYLTLALSYLQAPTPDFQKAQEQIILAQQNNQLSGADSYKAELEWLNALVLLKNGDDLAISALEKIAAKNSWYSDKAKLVLESLH